MSWFSWNSISRPWSTREGSDTENQYTTGTDAQKKQTSSATGDTSDHRDGIGSAIVKAFTQVIGAVVGFFTATIPSFFENAASDIHNVVTNNDSNHPGLVQRVENTWHDLQFKARKSLELPPGTVDTIRAAVAKRGGTAEQIEHDTLVLSSIVSGESGGNPNAVNKASHASGWFQFLPSTTRWLGVLDPFNPVGASEGAVNYLHQVTGVIAKQVYGGDESKVTDADKKLGWAFGGGGASELLKAARDGGSAVDALRNAHQKGDIVAAISGNLTAAEKAANPDLAHMSASTLVGIMASRFNGREQGVEASNASAFHIAPPPNSVPQPMQSADASGPQAVPQQRHSYIGLRQAPIITADQQVASAAPQKGALERGWEGLQQALGMDVS